MSLAVAEELVKLGVKKVEHLVDLDEAEVRAAAAASQLLPVQIKRLVKLRAAQVLKVWYYEDVYLYLEWPAIVPTG